MTTPTVAFPFFHQFAKPADYCRVVTAKRTNLVFDGDTIGGAVRIYLGYKFGPFMEQWQRQDGAAMSASMLDVGPWIYTTERGTWQGQPSEWTISNGEAYTTGPSGSLQSSIMNVHTESLDVDISCPIKATTGNAGFILRAGPNAVGNIYFINSALGRVQFATHPFVGSTGTVIFTGTTVITPGVFYTLRCVVVGDLYTFYVDGALEGSVSTSVDNSPALATSAHGVWATDTSSRFGSPFRIAKTQNPTATTYEVRNYDGDILLTGSVTDDHIDIPDSALRFRGHGPNGWYRIYLLGPDRGDIQWQTAYGDCSFYRIRTDPNFAANVGNRFISTGVGADGTDEYAHAVTPPGTVRFPVSSSTAQTPAINNASTLIGATELNAHWTSFAYSSRPRTLIGEFRDGTNGIASTITATVALLKNVIKTWEPRNEPYYDPRSNPPGGVQFVNNEFDAFRTAVKAGDPTARVIGPGVVTWSGIEESGGLGPVGVPAGYLAFVDQFIGECMARGGTAYLDGVSVHAYNCFNGDMALGRKLLSQLRGVMTARGYTGPLYQTEQGFQWEANGWEKPRHGGRWTMLMWFLCELYGLPFENNFYWYDADHGFYQFPMHWIDPLQGPGPQALPIRVMAAELADRTLVNQIDFGSVGNQLYAGGIWSRADGTKTVGLMAGTAGATNITLSVTGATTLTCVDPWGNTFTLTTAGGVATFPIAELPQWIRLPAGVTVTPVLPTFGTNFALGSTPLATGSQTNLANLANGIIENSYQGLAPVHDQYVDSSGVFPQTITLDLGGTVTANRVIIHAFPPWQPYSTLADFDVDTFDGATWTTRLNHPRPPLKTFPYTSVGRCIYESFWDEQHVFDVAFTSASITKVRVVIRGCSRGDTEHPTLKHDIYGDNVNDPDILAIQDIQVFGTGAIIAPPPPSTLRNPAMGGVTR